MWARMCPSGHHFPTVYGERLSQTPPNYPTTSSPCRGAAQFNASWRVQIPPTLPLPDHALNPAPAPTPVPLSIQNLAFSLQSSDPI